MITQPNGYPVEPLVLSRWLRAARRAFTRAYGWLRWHLWGKRYARQSIAMLELATRNRARRTH